MLRSTISSGTFKATVDVPETPELVRPFLVRLALQHAQNHPDAVFGMVVQLCPHSLCMDPQEDSYLRWGTQLYKAIRERGLRAQIVPQ